MELRKWRKAKKLTLSQVAQLVESTEATISRIETGKAFPSFKLMSKLQAATDGRGQMIFQANGRTGYENG